MARPRVPMVITGNALKQEKAATSPWLSYRWRGQGARRFVYRCVAMSGDEAHGMAFMTRWRGRFLRAQRMAYLSPVVLALGLCSLLLASCASTPAPSAPFKATGPALTLAVMGASDAWGIGTRDPDRLNWPTFLAGDLPRTAHLINLGVPGSTLATSLRQQAPVVLGERPDVLVVWLAVNDIIDGAPLAAYRADLQQLLASVKAQSPRTLVFIGNVPDLTQIPYFSNWNQTALRAEIAAWNAAIAQVCGAEGATLVDLYSVWGQVSEHPEYISRDGLHPSTRGADALALIFAIAIQQRLQATKR